MQVKQVRNDRQARQSIQARQVRKVTFAWKHVHCGRHVYGRPQVIFKVQLLSLDQSEK